MNAGHIAHRLDLREKSHDRFLVVASLLSRGPGGGDV